MARRSEERGTTRRWPDAPGDIDSAVPSCLEVLVRHLARLVARDLVDHATAKKEDLSDDSQTRGG